MNILGMGPMEILLIVVLALIVFGPAKLPEIMGQVGKAINDFRRATSELSDEFNRTIQAELQETRSVIDETKSAVSGMQATVSDLHASVTGMPAPTRTAIPGEALPAPVPAPNGISVEPVTETFTTNGTVQPQVLPPMADTAQWSWETSGPKATEAPALEAKTPAVETRTEVVEPGPGQPASPWPPASAPSPERIAHDELLPPY
jgi:TatA/E family protein of Tat protein translocase